MTDPGPSIGPRLATILRNRVEQAKWEVQAAPSNLVAWCQDRLHRRHYRELSIAGIVATRTADTVYVFGSGGSINDISAGEWMAIERANTISFREFPRQSFVRVDYHLSGEVDDIDGYAQRLRDNPRYRDAIMVVQEGWRARAGNVLVGRRLLNTGTRLFRYRRTSRGHYAPPSERFEDGLVHGFGSAISVTNFAYLMGWRTIVLAGVDLYDKRYFWLPDGALRTYEKPGLTVRSTFTGADDIVAMLGRWRDVLAGRGVSLEVLNPRSLLAAVMPVHRS